MIKMFNPLSTHWRNKMSLIIRSDLEAKKLPVIQKLAKSYGIPYKEYSKIGKKKITDFMLTPKKPEITGPNTRRKELEDGVSIFAENGGIVTECKPGKNLPRTPPTEKSAENNNFENKGKKKAPRPKSAKTSPQPTDRIRSGDVTTLQDIIDEVGITGAKARKLLRAGTVSKPGKQWVWPNGHKDIKTVTETLQLGAGISEAINVRLSTGRIVKC